MKLLFLKSLRTIRFNKIRYLGAIILIILSSALFTAFRTSGYSIQKSLDNFFENNNLADVSFEIIDIQNNNGLNTQDKEILNEYFDTVEERYYADIKNDGVTLRVFSDTKTQNLYQLIKGKDPKNQNEILLDYSFAKYHKISLNDYISINGKNALITGFFALPDYITVSSQENNVINDSDVFGLVITPNLDFWEISYKTEYLASINEDLDVEQKEQIFNNFKNTLLAKGYRTINWVERELNGRVTNAQGDISGFIEIGQILPIFILLVASFMLAIILNRQLIGEENIMGTFYAVGYRKRELLLHYMFLPFLLVTLGTITGGLIGYSLSPAISLIEITRYNLPIIVYSYNPFDLLIIFGIAFLIILPVTFFVTLHALKQPPLELMRGQGRRAKVSKIEKSIKIDKLNFRLKFFIRDILRNFGRHFILFLGMVISGMLLMLGLGIFDSINNIDTEIKNTFHYQNIYSYGANIQFSENVDGEDYFESTALVQKGNKYLKTSLRFMDQGSKSIVQHNKKTKKTIDYSKMAVSYSVAKHLKIKQGDTIKIIHKGLPFDNWEFKVDIITDYVLGDVIFLPKQLLIQEFNSHYRTKVDNIYNIVISDKKLDGMQNTVYTDIYEYLTKTIDQVTGALITAISIIGLSAIVVAIILVHIVVDLILEENKYNIALFKMFGYTSRKVNGLILNGGILFAAAGLILSYPLDLCFIGYILNRFTQGMNVLVNPYISWLTALIAFVIAGTVYGLSRLVASKKISKVPIGEALKNSEQ
ncbi:MAG TPA: ABC transporter permease [Clostridia bacterium]